MMKGEWGRMNKRHRGLKETFTATAEYADAVLCSVESSINRPLEDFFLHLNLCAKITMRRNMET